MSELSSLAQAALDYATEQETARVSPIEPTKDIVIGDDEEQMCGARSDEVQESC